MGCGKRCGWAELALLHLTHKALSSDFPFAKIRDRPLSGTAYAPLISPSSARSQGAESLRADRRSALDRRRLQHGGGCCMLPREGASSRTRGKQSPSERAVSKACGPSHAGMHSDCCPRRAHRGRWDPPPSQLPSLPALHRRPLGLIIHSRLLPKAATLSRHLRGTSSISNSNSNRPALPPTAPSHHRPLCLQGGVRQGLLVFKRWGGTAPAGAQPGRLCSAPGVQRAVHEGDREAAPVGALVPQRGAAAGV
jgi:hypothetical protein